ncbi:chromosome condensation protein [Schaalia georgiae]|nr:chromosome condensation protein [Schaalia georgiae]
MSIDPRITAVELYELARNRDLWSPEFFYDLEQHGEAWLELRDWCLAARGVQNLAEIPDPPALPAELAEKAQSRSFFSRVRGPKTKSSKAPDAGVAPAPKHRHKRKRPSTQKQAFTPPLSSQGSLLESVPLPAIIVGGVVALFLVIFVVAQLTGSEHPQPAPDVADGAASGSADTPNSGAPISDDDMGATEQSGQGSPAASASGTLTAGGQAFSCTAKKTEVSCAGENSMGQLGNADITSAHLFTFYLPTAIHALAAGDDFVCAATSTEVWCWGDNRWGQSGHGTAETAAPQPVIGVPGGDITGLAAGRAHACALTKDRGVWCWGVNTAHQVSDSDETYMAPTQIPGTEKMTITSIEAANFTTFAHTASGESWAWGDNTRHQITSDDTPYLPMTQLTKPTSGTGDFGRTASPKASAGMTAPTGTSGQRSE